MFVGESGWQFVADPNAVKTAMEKVAEAEDTIIKSQKDLADTAILQEKQKYLDSLRFQEETMDKTYEGLKDQWDETLELIKEMQNPTEEITEILRQMAEDQTPELQEILSKTSEAVRDFLSSFGESATGATQNKTGNTQSAKKYGTGFTENNGIISEHQYLINKVEWENASPERKKALNLENQAYRNSHGIQEDSISSKAAKELLAMGYDNGGVLKGLGGLKATRKDEIVLDPQLSMKLLEPQKSSQFTALVDNLHKLIDIPKNAINNIANTSQNIVYQLNMQGVIKELNGNEMISDLFETFQRNVPLYNVNAV